MDFLPVMLTGLPRKSLIPHPPTDG